MQSEQFHQKKQSTDFVWQFSRESDWVRLYVSYNAPWEGETADAALFSTPN